MIGKQNNIKDLGSRVPTGLQSHLCLTEENISFNNNYIYLETANFNNKSTKINCVSAEILTTK